MSNSNCCSEPVFYAAVEEDCTGDFVIEVFNDSDKVGTDVAPQWRAVDAEIEVPSNENTELKRSYFKAWSRSVYSHTCYAYFQGFLPCLFLPFRPIHLHFFPKPLPIFPVLAVANTWFLCRPAE